MDHMRKMCHIIGVEIYVITTDSKIFLKFDSRWSDYYIKFPTLLESAHLQLSQRTNLQPTKYMQYNYHDRILHAFKNIGDLDMVSFHIQILNTENTVPIDMEVYDGFRAVNVKKNEGCK